MEKYNHLNVAGLDFETYSAAPLPEVGLANYIADPTFKPLLAAVAMPTATYHFELQDKQMHHEFVDLVGNTPLMLTAHNAGFERAVLRHMGINRRVIDSAVVAAVSGADRHLRGAAAQLLDRGKLDEDGALIRRFCIPGKHQVEGGTLEWEEWLPRYFATEWAEFIQYCKRDAELSRDLVVGWGGVAGYMLDKEWYYADLTLEMNETGWPVDLDLVRQFRDRYRQNMQAQLTWFEQNVDSELNLRSHSQLVKWCRDRGVRARSFDKESRARMLAKLEAKPALTDGENQVRHMLETKEAIGGSALSKLDVILDVAHGGRVYDQYVHAGAGQSLRTSGRNVQMQNLKRLGAIVRDVSTVSSPNAPWSNEDLAQNMRQLFRAENPYGLLFVADFAAIESRGLAWLAGEQWKLDAYADGKDLYVELAKQMYQSAASISPEMRSTGKVGELSCGYGAGPGAVQDFAAKMKLAFTEGQARKLVTDWRDACPKTVELWNVLQKMAEQAVDSGVNGWHDITHDRALSMRAVQCPDSLTTQEPAVYQSLVIELVDKRTGRVLMKRVFHGVHRVGRDLAYFKPSSLKSGPLWKNTYINPKTKRSERHKLYGGKLAGILTQSLCREIFFERLEVLHDRLKPQKGAQIIGQFHDEVVVEWWPHPQGITKRELKVLIEDTFSYSTISDFPIAVKVESSRRYEK